MNDFFFVYNFQLFTKKSLFQPYSNHETLKFELWCFIFFFGFNLVLFLHLGETIDLLFFFNSKKKKHLGELSSTIQQLQIHHYVLNSIMSYLVILIPKVNHYESLQSLSMQENAWTYGAEVQIVEGWTEKKALDTQKFNRTVLLDNSLCVMSVGWTSKLSGDNVLTIWCSAVGCRTSWCRYRLHLIVFWMTYSLDFTSLATSVFIRHPHFLLIKLTKCWNRRDWSLSGVTFTNPCLHS